MDGIVVNSIRAHSVIVVWFEFKVTAVPTVV